MELDLGLLLRQNDYIEERVPQKMKKFQGYRRQGMKHAEIEKTEMNMFEQTQNLCKPPDLQDFPKDWPFVWENLSVDDRVKRAANRAHIDCQVEAMEPNFTKSAFDFYGCYVRISEA